MRKLRVGVIGAGRRSVAHLPLIRTMSDKLELAAVCDAVPERARQAGEKYDIPWYSSLEELLARETLDIADIVLPPDAHHVVAVMAARHGLHVMVETPIGITRPCIDAIIEAARENRVKVEVAEQVWRWPEERLKRRVIESGLIGEPLRVYCQLRTGAYHAANALRAYTGWAKPRRVWGMARSFKVQPFLNFGEATENEHWDHAIIEFANGIIGIHEFVSDWLSPFRRSLPRRLGVDATQGAIVENDVFVFAGGETRQFSIHTETVPVGGVAVPTCYRIDSDPPVVWENPYAIYPVGDPDGIGRLDYWHSLYRAIVEDGEPDYGPWQGRKDQELPIAQRQSALQGGLPVELPLTEVAPYEERLHREYAAKYGGDPLADIEMLAARTFPHTGVRGQA